MTEKTPDVSMDLAKRADVCLSVATIAAARFDKRRDFDWKMCLSIWGLVVGAILYVRATAFPIEIGVLVFMLHYLWAKIVFVRNSSDQEICWTALRRVDQIFAKADGEGFLPPKDPRIQNSTKNDFILDWSARIYLAITLALIALFYAVRVQSITLWEIGSIAISKPG